MFELLILAASVGFFHAFEADHLVAVSSIATSRNKLSLAIKDGFYWGLGHTSILLLVGGIYLLGKFVIRESDFHYFEAAVGLMLVVLGISRLVKLIRNYQHQAAHTVGQPHSHKLAYGIGAVHGLAGSGAVLLAVLAETHTVASSLGYILVFGAGSVLGMMVVSGLFSLPISSKFTQNKWLGWGLSFLSALVCIGLGIIIFKRNMA